MKMHILVLYIITFLMGHIIFIQSMDVGERSAAATEQTNPKKSPKILVPHITINMKTSHRETESPSSRSDEKQTIATVEDLCTLVRRRSHTAQLPQKRMGLQSPKRVKKLGDSISEEEEVAEPAILLPEYLELKQSIVKKITEEVCIAPSVLVATEYKLRGELQKTPRKYEVEGWEKIQNENPVRFEGAVVDVLDKLLDCVQEIEKGMHDPQDVEAVDKFANTHVALLQNHIDEQDKSIEKKNLFIQAVLAVCAVMTIGLTVWGAVQTHAASACGNMTAT